jgi:hypothetical protein
MEKNTTPRITKAQKFAMLKAIPAVAENPMLVEFIDHEVDLLTKKNASEKKLTPQQKANEVIKDNILATMSANPNRLFTITELTKEVPNLPEDMSVNRMSALVRQLKDDGKVVRIEEKRKALFRIA